MPSDLSGYPPEIAALLEEYNREVGTLMGQLEADKLSAAVWKKEFQKLLATFSQAAYLLGYGDGDAAIPVSVEAWLKDQFGYLDGFANVIQAAGEYDPAWLPRAQMYGASAVTEYWEGKVGDLPLPAMPGQGTQCLCITTPWSKVTTTRGSIAIADIKPGDMVLTHRGRFQPVLSTSINLSRRDHQQAWIMAPNGARIGCTSDHKFLTFDGWKTAKSIDNSLDRIYIYSHEEILFYMRNAFRKPEQDRPMQVVQVNLSLREIKGPSGCGMYLLWNEPKGEGTVDYKPRENPFGDPRCRAKALENAGEYNLRIIHQCQSRWPALYLLSRRNWEKTLSISVPMGVDPGAWSNSSWLRDPPHQRGQDRRSPRESGVDEPLQTQWVAPYGRAQKSDDRRWWPGLYREDKNGESSYLDVPTLRKNVQGLSERRSYRPEILLEGMLPERTPLYDIEVAEDHSFVIEGLISHNSNCRCSWRIEWIDREKGDADAYWEMDAAAENCQTCQVRHRDWYPVEIRGGQLQ